MGNSALVWWLLGAPLVLAIIDRMRIGGSSAMGSGREERAPRQVGDPRVGV